MTKKLHFEPNLGSLGPNLGSHFFKKNLASSVTRYHDHLSSCTISEKKTNDLILGKLSDGRTDERE